MDKIIFQEQSSSSLSEWLFPSLRSSSNKDDALPFKKSNPADDEIEKLKNELEILKAEYNKKINIITGIIKNLEGEFNQIDEKIIGSIHHIIENITKKLIQQEIKINPNLVKNIVDQAMKLLRGKYENVMVTLSENDLNLIDKTQFNESISFCSDATLSEGDVILKSTDVDIFGTLSDRINKIIGSQNV
jgi:hypothetical protein